jgi:hypothetical protein
MSIETLAQQGTAKDPSGSSTCVPVMTLGPFIIDSRGMLTPGSPDRFPAFTVQWRRILVRARLVQAAQENAADLPDRLEFSARLGRVPSSARTTENANQRTAALQVLRRMHELLPPGWRLLLRADHSVEVAAHVPILMPVSAVSLITEVTMFLLNLEPYFNVLEEGGVTAFGGSANI